MKIKTFLTSALGEEDWVWNRLDCSVLDVPKQADY